MSKRKIGEYEHVSRFLLELVYTNSFSIPYAMDDTFLNVELKDSWLERMDSLLSRADGLTLGQVVPEWNYDKYDVETSKEQDIYWTLACPIDGLQHWVYRHLYPNDWQTLDRMIMFLFNYITVLVKR